MKGIVNKPQFDINIFKPGVAIKFNTSQSIFGSYTSNGIILESSPLEIKVLYLEENEENYGMCKSIDSNIKKIGINDYESYNVKFLKPEEEA